MSGFRSLLVLFGPDDFPISAIRAMSHLLQTLERFGARVSGIEEDIWWASLPHSVPGESAEGWPKRWLSKLHELIPEGVHHGALVVPGLTESGDHAVPMAAAELAAVQGRSIKKGHILLAQPLTSSALNAGFGVLPYPGTDLFRCLPEDRTHQWRTLPETGEGPSRRVLVHGTLPWESLALSVKPVHVRRTDVDETTLWQVQPRPLIRGDHLLARIRASADVWLYLIRLRDLEYELLWGDQPIQPPGRPRSGPLEIVLDDTSCIERLVLVAASRQLKDLETLIAETNHFLKPDIAAGTASAERCIRAFGLVLGDRAPGVDTALLCSEAFPHVAAPTHLLPAELEQARAAFEANDFPAAARLSRDIWEHGEPALRDRAGVILGTALRRMGEYSDALEILREAAASCEARGDHSWTAIALREEGRTLVDQRNPQLYEGALQRFDRAIAMHRELDDRIEEARDLQYVALVLWAQARYAAARETYSRTIDPARLSDQWRLVASGLEGLGNVAHEVGSLEEAHRLFLEVRSRFCRLNDLHGLARVHGNLGMVALQRRDVAAAIDHFDRQLELVMRVGTPIYLSYTRLNLAQALLGAGRLEEARQLFAGELFLLGTEDEVRILALTALAEIAMTSDQMAEATVRLEEVVAFVRALNGGEAPRAERSIQRLGPSTATETLAGVRRAELLLECHIRIAHAFARWYELTGVGDPEAVYQEGIREVEDTRSRLPAGLRATFLTARAELYEAWLEWLVRSHRPAEVVLSAMERARAQALRDALASIDTREHPAGSTAMAEADRSGALEQHFSLAAFQERLRENEALLVTWCLPTRLLLGWVTRGTLDYHAAEVKREELEALCDEVSRYCESDEDRWQEPETDRCVASERAIPLSSRWQPVLEQVWKWLEATGQDSILGIVPHGPLHGVPLHAFPMSTEPTTTNAVPLIASHVVFYTPALHAVDHWLDPKSGRGSGMVVMADPDGDLACAEKEVRQIVEIMGESWIGLGRDATWSALREKAPSAQYLHLAVHASQGSDGSRAVLKLAPDPNAHSEPLGWWEALGQPQLGEPPLGTIDVPAILNLKLVADLVVLAACEAGAGKLNACGDGLDVLSWAFLSAGARSVVSSAWRAHDYATSRLMREYYRRLAQEEPRALALAHAQRMFLQPFLQSQSTANANAATPGVEACFSSPRYWSAFSLMGEWR